MTAKEYAAYANNVRVTIGDDDEKTFEEYIEDAFNAGMQEMREQMMKDATEGVAHPDDQEIWCDLDKYNLEDCEKVRIIVIKED